MHSRILILLVALIFFNNLLFSQQKITGKFTDTNNKGIGGLTVFLKDYQSKDSIIGYDITSDNGEFAINTVEFRKNLILCSRSLTYQDSCIAIISNKHSPIKVTLKEKQIDIESVTVTRRGVERRGDTLVYLVDKFQTTKDLSIGDVLKKMPGFTVEQNGNISYQGKPISKLFINGTDLLEGQYGLATNNLPHSSVGTVQVIENYQSVKALNGIIPSDAPAVNLSLKQGIAFTGITELGGGGTPELHRINVTPMFFTKSNQFILSFQANNTGYDLSDQIKSFAMTSGVAILFEDEKESLTPITNIQTPNIDKKRYLDNNSMLFSFKGLQKLGESSDLKISVNLLSDVLEKNSSSTVNYILLDTLIRFTEHIYNKTNSKQLHVGTIWEANKERVYFKNITNFKQYWDNELGYIKPDSSSFQQRASLPSLYLNNSLNGIVRFNNKNFINISSNIKYWHSPHYSDYNPFLYNIGSITNDSSTVQQRLSKNQFISTNQLNYTHRIKRIAMGLTSGIDVDKNILSSKIIVQDNPVTSDSLRNKLNTLDLSTYFSPNFMWEKKKINISVDVSLRSRHIGINNELTHVFNTINRLTVDPVISIRYSSYLFNCSFSYKYNQSLSNPSSQLNGYIINDYRTLNNVKGAISEKRSNSLFSYINYKNHITGLFINSNFRISFFESNALDSININNNLRTVTSITKYNKGLSATGYFTSSYFISRHSITIGLSGIYNNVIRSVLLNGELTKSNVSVLNIKPSLSIMKIKNMSLEVNSKFDFQISKVGRIYSKYNSKTNSLKLSYILKKMIFCVETDLYVVKINGDKTQNTYFNFSYNYNILNNRIKLEFRCNNIFNKNSYAHYIQSDTYSISNIYMVRPREFYISLSMPLIFKASN